MKFVFTRNYQYQGTKLYTGDKRNAWGSCGSSAGLVDPKLAAFNRLGSEVVLLDMLPNVEDTFHDTDNGSSETQWPCLRDMGNPQQEAIVPCSTRGE